MRRVSIENFAECAQAIAIDAFRQRLQKGQRCRPILVDAIMREREWTEQPAPDSSLMIRRVTLTHAAGVAPRVRQLTRREAT